MARAEVKAVVSADIGPLEKAFAEAKEKAKELGKGIGEVGNDLGKGLTGFDIGKMLGIGGAIYAAGKLGEALIDAAKEGYKAFQQYQDAVLKFKYNLPSSAGTLEERGKMGAEAAETSESKAGAFTSDQLNKASISLMEASKEFRESPEKLNSMVDTLTALAIKSGGTPDAIADAWRRLVVGIKEEGGAAVGKFFKTTPGLEEETEKLRAEHAASYLKSQGLGTAAEGSAAQKAEYGTLANMPIDEFMTQESQRVGGTAVLEEIRGILERSAPKEITAEEEAIHPEKMLAAAFEKVNKAFGEELTPVINDLVNVILHSMPTIKDDFMALADALKSVIPIVTFFSEVLSGVNMMVNSVIQSITNKLADWLGINKAGTDAASVAAGVDKRLSEGGGTSGSYTGGLYFGPETKPETPEAPTGDAVAEANAKSIATAADEASKINIKTASEHAASQRQIDFANTQAAFLEQTRAAVRQATSLEQPQNKSLLSQEYSEQQAGVVRVINIQAAAAAKIRALDEESAQKIAKIKEEQALRAVTRAAEDAEDKTQAQKDARAQIRAAQDATSQQAIDDLHADAAQKIRDENEDAAGKIIDQQEASAKNQVALIMRFYDDLIAKKEGPYKFTPDEGPIGPETYNEWAKEGGGLVIEGSHERKIREQKNKEGQEAVDRANEAYQKQQESTALAGVKGVKYDQSGLSGAVNIAAAYDPKTGAKTDTKFDFSKGVSEQTKGNLLLEAIYKQFSSLLAVFSTA